MSNRLIAVVAATFATKYRKSPNCSHSMKNQAGMMDKCEQEDIPLYGAHQAFDAGLGIADHCFCGNKILSRKGRR